MSRPGRLEGASIIEEGPVKFVRTPNLALSGGHAVNGVAALHTEILKSGPFKDFHEMFSGKAASGHAMAKRVVKLINGAAKTINTDERIGDGPRAIYIPNDSVSLAETIISTANPRR